GSIGRISFSRGGRERDSFGVVARDTVSFGVPNGHGHGVGRRRGDDRDRDSFGAVTSLGGRDTVSFGIVGGRGWRERERQHEREVERERERERERKNERERQVKVKKKDDVKTQHGAVIGTVGPATLTLPLPSHAQAQAQTVNLGPIVECTASHSFSSCEAGDDSGVKLDDGDLGLGYGLGYERDGDVKVGFVGDDGERERERGRVNAERVESRDAERGRAAEEFLMLELNRSEGDAKGGDANVKGSGS
ncbi:hypothetical protein CVT24_007328, partial [Panaeolus cyanescens]